MYQLTVFFDQPSQEQAEELSHAIAMLCDRLVGQPATEDDELPYLLKLEAVPDVGDDGLAKLTWVMENLLTEDALMMVVPSPD